MANEKRLIDANALLEKLSRMIEYCKTDSKVNGLTALFQVGDAVMDCPTIDAVEVVHGRWIETEEEVWHLYQRRTITRFRCSQCEQTENKKSNYCPNCGADMRERKPDD